jgi:diadenosine tetraphosphate (Ap4A) HIT family hydrolase
MLSRFGMSILLKNNSPPKAAWRGILKWALCQLIPHVHCHIVPRNDGDGLEFHPKTIDISEDEMKEIAEKIKV